MPFNGRLTSRQERAGLGNSGRRISACFCSCSVVLGNARPGLNPPPNCRDWFLRDKTLATLKMGRAFTEECIDAFSTVFAANGYLL